MLDTYTAHAWSLSIEEQFYLFWPLIFMTGNKIRKLFIVAIITLIPICRIVFYYHQVSWINELSIVYRLDAIATGCLFAFYQEYLIKILTPYFRMLFFIIVISLFIIPFTLISISTKYNLHLDFLFLAFGNTYGTLANIIIVFIIMLSIYASSNKWFRFLNSKIMEQIGIWSYSIYLWQQLFTYDTKSFFIQFPLNILFLFIVALFSYYVIERPFLKLKSRFTPNSGCRLR